MRIAVDIGGTFTDVVLQSGERRVIRKVLTTAMRPEEAVIHGMRQVLLEAGLLFSDIEVFVHGTTLATNAIIERRGARCALIATDGFRDVLEIGNEGRYDQYELNLEKPVPLVDRSMRFTVPERMDARGEVRRPLDENSVLALIPILRRKAVESIAISFLHGYANSKHERRAAELLKEHLPDVFLSMASDVCPEIREYERTSTVVANAYVQPLLAGYLSRMTRSLADEGFAGTTYLVTSGGSLTSVDIAARYPVRLVESGPAGGAIFAARIAMQCDESKVLAFDMGGTTAKLCVIDDGTPSSGRLFEVDRAARFMKGSGLPIRIPVIDMVEIGSGGGSIAKVDVLRRVVVGPQSAASRPGPACYGLGGDKATVTDADLVLGLLDPGDFAGGSMTLQPAAARSALDRDIAVPLALSSDLAAHAVHEVVCENMASAARVHTVERGVSVGDYTLIAFGGAAPLHVSRVAEKIGIRRVVIPPDAGVGSAVGFLSAPIAFEITRSHRCSIDTLDGEVITQLLNDMSSEARAIVEPGALGEPLIERRTAFMRYIGQGHEIAVVVPHGPVSNVDTEVLRDAYESQYAAMFNRIIPDADIEVMSWSILVSTEFERPKPYSTREARTQMVCDGVRRLFDGRSKDHILASVYRREALPEGATVSGPAVIVEKETSTFVSGSFDAYMDGGGCIVMNRKPSLESAP